MGNLTERIGSLTVTQMTLPTFYRKYLPYLCFLLMFGWMCTDETNDNDSPPLGNSAGTNGDTTGQTDASMSRQPAALRGGCESERLIGSFELDSHNASISGQVKNAVVPSVIRETVAEQGACKLTRQLVLFCEKVCTAGQSCSAEGTCIDAPTNQNLGTVSIDGIATPIEIPPNPPSYLYFDTKLTSPPFEPGAPIHLRASGGDLSGFDLYGKGVEPLLGADSVWTVVTGQELAISWAKGTIQEAKVMISFSLDQHGVTPVQMVCEVEDTGSFIISSQQIDNLMELGVTVPTIGIIERHTVDSIYIEQGCIEFKIVSRSSVEVHLG